MKKIMKKIKNYKHKRRVFFLLSLALLIVFPMTGVMYSAEDNDNDFSFYRIASAAATYYDDAHNASSGRTFNDTDVSAGNAGGLLGFLDEDFGDGFIGATVSKLSSSSQAHSYAAYASNKNIHAYVAYGHLLKTLGFDSTANGVRDMGSIARSIGAFILEVVFTFAIAIDAIFTGFIKVLQVINPFSFFKLVGQNSFLQNALINTNQPVLVGVARFTSTMYDAFYKFSWAYTVPLLIIFVVVFWAFVKLTGARASESPGRKFRKLLLRMVFLMFGLPILGNLYTATLDSIVGTNAQSSYASNGLPGSSGKPIGSSAASLVAGTLIDFEGWARSSHLSLPQGIVLETEITSKNPAGSPTSKTLNLDFNKIAREINGESATAGLSFEYIRDLIRRYGSSAFYNEADFEIERKRTLDVTTANKKDLYDTFKAMTDYKNYGDATVFTNPKGNIGAGYGTEAVRITMDGKLNFKKDANKFVYTGSGKVYHGHWFENHFNGGASGIVSVKALSTLSMYNYLTTSFDDTSFVVYSSYKVGSDFTRKAHRSVNLVGPSMFGVFNYLRTVLLLGIAIIIGIFYGFSMLFNTLKRTIRIILAIPFSALGGLKAAAQIVTYTMMMVVEVLGTVFLYFLIIELVYQITDIFRPIYDHMTDTLNPTGTILMGNTVLLPLFSFNLIASALSIIMMVWFTKWALKLRKHFIRTLDEAFAKQIDQLFMLHPEGGAGGEPAISRQIVNDSHAPKQQKQGGGTIKNVVGSTVGAATTGAGMAYGQKLSQNVGAGTSKPKGETKGVATAPKPGKASPSGSTEGFENQRPIVVTNINNNTTQTTEDQNSATGFQDVPITRPSNVLAKDTSKSKQKDEEKEEMIKAKQNELLGEASALDVEKAKEDQKNLKKQYKFKAGQAKKDAVFKTARGTVKAVAGAKTGNAALAASGAQEAGEGLQNAKTSEDMKRSASRNARVVASKQLNEKAKQQKTTNEPKRVKPNRVESNRAKPNEAQPNVSATDDAPKDSPKPVQPAKKTLTEYKPKEVKQEPKKKNPPKTLEQQKTTEYV